MGGEKGKCEDGENERDFPLHVSKLNSLRKKYLTLINT